MHGSGRSRKRQAITSWLYVEYTLLECEHVVIKRGCVVGEPAGRHQQAVGETGLASDSPAMAASGPARRGVAPGEDAFMCSPISWATVHWWRSSVGSGRRKICLPAECPLRPAALWLSPVEADDHADGGRWASAMASNRRARCHARPRRAGSWTARSTAWVTSSRERSSSMAGTRCCKFGRIPSSSIDAPARLDQGQQSPAWCRRRNPTLPSRR